jgi:sortase A
MIIAYSSSRPASKPLPQPYTKVTQNNQAAPSPKIINWGIPVRLQISAINVDTAIEYTGLTKTGDMTAPTGINNAGWYKLGTIPGNVGSAVMDGHVVGPKGEPGVFFHLDKLQPGDIVLVTYAKGQDASFTVRETKTYDGTLQPSEVFNSKDGVHLNLITCAGDWDASQHHYLKRLVIFTDKTT